MRIWGSGVSSISPTTLCEMFLQEVSKKNPIDSLGSGDAVHHQ